MKLPRLPRRERQNLAEVTVLRGLNYSDNFADGDLAETENLSARRYPYIATRHARTRQTAYSGVTALGAWEKLVAVAGGKLYYDGRQVGTVSDGEKQFAVVNTKLVIWPDKKCLDMESLTVKDLGAEASGTRAVFTGATVTLTGAPNLTGLFKAGDTVTVSGCAAQAGNNRDVTVKSLTATAITAAAGSFTAGTETGTITLKRRIPDLDFICESENRLWGCSNEAKTIYASALGDPTNFYTYDGLSTDSYAVAVGSEGDFTGCCRLSGAVLFWKERKLHKLLGSYPAEYMISDYDVEGPRRGCHKSQRVINETLFYMGLHGVYAYTNGTPTLISPAFGARDFGAAVAGDDGDRYYLSVTEGDTASLLVYDTRYGLWLREDGTRCVDFARLGKQLYFLTDGGTVWLADGGEDDPGLEWSARFAPMYETAQGRKRYARLTLRVELPKGSWLRAEARFDGGQWREVGKLNGRDFDAAALRIPIARCDKLELRLSGKGPCTVLQLLREFSVGSGR